MPTDLYSHRELVLGTLRHLNNPAGLCRSALLELPSVRAQLSVPSDASTQAQALAMRDLLHTLIEQMRPPGHENLKQRAWLHYYLLHHLFRRGATPQQVQATLAVSHSYFYKLRDEAVGNFTALLLAGPAYKPSSEQEKDPSLRAISRNVSVLETIPSVEGFVGRASELRRYRHDLRTRNLAVIVGFAGTGKTTIAAQLAAEYSQHGEQVLWISLAAGINTEGYDFLSGLALALDELGQSDLHRNFGGNTLNDHSYPVDVAIQMATNALVASRVMLCLDNVHLVESGTHMQRLLSCLTSHSPKARVPMMLVSRLDPLMTQYRPVVPLHELDRDDARLFLNQNGVTWLSDCLFPKLYERSTGNASMLRYFLDWAQSLSSDDETCNRRAEAFIMHHGFSPTALRRLFSDVVESLHEIDYAILEPLAICNDGICLDGAFHARLFVGLGEDVLLERFDWLIRRQIVLPTEDGCSYRMNGLMRTIVQGRLAQHPDRQARVHKLAARYYEALGSMSEAAYHYARSRITVRGSS